MKNKLLKYYIVVAYFCTNVLLIAQNPPPPIYLTDNEDPQPIDDYLILLAVVGILLVFLGFKVIQAKQKQANSVF